MDAPFSLQKLDYILARIMTVQRNRGDSLWSEIGGTAFIPIKPSEPTKLKRVEADCELTPDGKVQIGISWEPPFNNNESSVIAYKVSFDQGKDTWVDQDLKVNRFDHVQTGLEPGLTYRFMIKPRNVLEYGDASEPFAVLAATLPS